MGKTELDAVLAASPGRRMIGVGSLGGLGAIMLYMALALAPGLGWQAFQVGLGGVALWCAQRMWRATAERLELSAEGLRSSDGRILAPMDDIVAVDRGVFAFKPSNGFMITLRHKGPFVWEPGLWWRIGRKVGVGGVTPGTPAKYMAELIQERIAARGS
ncbi:hypothetical protein [Roseovarius autotrophicus]|uniref:hypothetical protein n=1 Tax=Roseovarius autotrophicus TaxID=2824121 RepID=UPI0019FF6C30|nr:hypothetical protein [Roseovarius autotrophicus]MBE0452260.1 hypothetical protein [Roseovarius sp.]